MTLEKRHIVNLNPEDVVPLEMVPDLVSPELVAVDARDLIEAYSAKILSEGGYWKAVQKASYAVPGEEPQLVNGKTLGFLRNGRYVEVDYKKSDEQKTEFLRVRFYRGSHKWVHGDKYGRWVYTDNIMNVWSVFDNNGSYEHGFVGYFRKGATQHVPMNEAIQKIWKTIEEY